MIGLSVAVAVALCSLAACFVKNRALQADNPNNGVAVAAGRGVGSSVQYRQLHPTYDVPAEGDKDEARGTSADEYAVYAHWPTIDPVDYLPSSLALSRDRVRWPR